MAAPLPRLRDDLDLMPSPLPEQPGLLLRDPFRYSTATLVVPPLLARCLVCFDGRHDEADLCAELARISGQLAVAEPARRLVAALRDAGFLDDDRFSELRQSKIAAFAASPSRAPAHAGGAYPAEPAPLSQSLRRTFDNAGPNPPDAAADQVVGIAAPHVSPEGGGASFARAYRAIPAAHGDRVFVVLGTSHHGQPDRFGLTRKPFATPFGVARTEVTLVDELARKAPGSVLLEDYCHAVEHSVELQVVFLQFLFGPGVRILPILCGPFAAGPLGHRSPEASEAVARFIGALGELRAGAGSRLSFVLGVDFAHIGRRYGDAASVRAHEGRMGGVAARDRERLDRVTSGDAAGFAELVWQGGADDLRWCGSSPLYTFLRALPGVRGRLLAYEQWNIDEASVVSFGALVFHGDSGNKNA